MTGRMIGVASSFFVYFFIVFISIKTALSYRAIKVNQLNRGQYDLVSIGRTRDTRCYIAENSLLSLAAGALAGSIGVGVAYPLDALKTKAQTYASSKDAPSGLQVLSDAEILLCSAVELALSFPLDSLNL